MLKAILWNTIGGGAIKALVGGVASGAVASGTMLAGVCDLQTLGQQVGGVAGAALFGYLATWISPANKSKRDQFPPAPGTY